MHIKITKKFDEKAEKSLKISKKCSIYITKCVYVTIEKQNVTKKYGGIGNSSYLCTAKQKEIEFHHK